MNHATATVIGRLEPSPLLWRWVHGASPSGAEMDRGLSARATFARTGPPALVALGDRDARGLELAP